MIIDVDLDEDTHHVAALHAGRQQPRQAGHSFVALSTTAYRNALGKVYRTISCRGRGSRLATHIPYISSAGPIQFPSVLLSAATSQRRTLEVDSLPLDCFNLKERSRQILLHRLAAGCGRIKALRAVLEDARCFPSVQLCMRGFHSEVSNFTSSSSPHRLKDFSPDNKMALSLLELGGRGCGVRRSSSTRG